MIKIIKYAEISLDQVDGLTGKEFTYRDCHDLSLSFAKSLQEMGAQKGDVMAILMPNKVEYVLAMFGASAVGVIREICTKIQGF